MREARANRSSSTVRSSATVMTSERGAIDGGTARPLAFGLGVGVDLGNQGPAAPFEQRVVPRRTARIVVTVGIGTRLEQDAHHRDVVPMHGRYQRRLTRIIGV